MMPEERDYRPDEDKKPHSVRPNKMATEIISFLRTLAAFFAVAFILRASVVEAFKIPSGSMLNTLHIGDHILVSKFAYGLRVPFLTNTVFNYKTPERGDIVVFTRPDDESGQGESHTNIIKRVIGLPNDVVQVQGTKVYINNVALTEPYARWVSGGIPDGNFGPARVPPDRIFLLGDNRDQSKDSRFWVSDHFLSVDRIKGKALIIYWSFDSISRIGTIIR